MDLKSLRSIPLFAELDDDEDADLASIITSRHLHANEPLFWVGDTGNEFFVVRSGRVAVSCPDQSGKDIRLATIGAGDFLGELSLLDGGPRTATARALTDTTLICLDRKAFQSFLLRCPGVAIRIMTVLGRRQRHTVEKLRGIRSLEEVMQEKMTPWQQIANAVAAMAGGHRFLMAHAILFGSWIAMNLLAGRSRAPDPFPFSFLSFWASVEAIFLSLFIMISQSLQSQKDRIRTELDYQVALKVQLEIMQLHQKMDELPTMMIERLREAPETDKGSSLATAE